MDATSFQVLTMADSEDAEILDYEVQYSRNPPFSNRGLSPFLRFQQSINLTECFISGGYSCGAFDCGKLIAVLFAYKRQRDGEVFQFGYRDSNDEKLKWSKFMADKYEEMADVIESQVDVFKHYKVDEIVHLCSLSVHDDYSNRGLGYQLVDFCITNALKRGVKAFYTRTSSLYSMKIFEKLNFDRLASLNYDNFLGDDGRPVFNPPHPHVEYVMWGKVYE